MAQKKKEKERKKNNTKYSGHFVSLQRLRAANALGLDQQQGSEKSLTGVAPSTNGLQ